MTSPASRLPNRDLPSSWSSPQNKPCSVGRRKGNASHCAIAHPDAAILQGRGSEAVRDPREYASWPPPGQLSDQANSAKESRRLWIFETPRSLLSSLKFDLPFWNGQSPPQRQSEAQLLQDTTDRALEVLLKLTNPSTGAAKP